MGGPELPCWSTSKEVKYGKQLVISQALKYHMKGTVCYSKRGKVGVLGFVHPRMNIM